MANGFPLRPDDRSVAPFERSAGDVVRAVEPSFPKRDDGEAEARPQGMPGHGPLLPSSPTLAELFAVHPRDAGWTRLLAAALPRAGPVLWVQERMAILEAGRIHPPGLGDFPPIIHVTAPDTPRLLWVMEEGLRCTGLAAVIGEAWGEHARMDFTATRRLAFASERQGVPCWLVRLGAGQANLSGARWRWRVESLPSLAHPFDPKAPGASRLTLDRFRARGHPPGVEEWADERAAGPSPDRVDLAPAPVDRAMGEA